MPESRGPVLGVIADDYTGATDVATALRRAGLRPAVVFGGEPNQPIRLDGIDAVVVALKIRTVPAADAVRAALAAADWLRGLGAETLYYKYCSTFDSTDSGNIGPVVDALLDRTGAGSTIICPTSPQHGRTVYGGLLFVHDQLLSDSPMRFHPLTPMTDANLVRVLGRQTAHRVGLLPHAVVRAGSDAVRARLAAMAADGVRHIVVDSIDDADLDVVAAASEGLPVLTGAAGLAGALRRPGQPPHPAANTEVGPSTPLPVGPSVVLAGSCSATTLRQVAHARDRMPSHRLDPRHTPTPAEMRDSALAWMRDNVAAGPLLVYSSAPPEDRAPEEVDSVVWSDVFEQILGEVASLARELGARRIVVAGGETSGAVIQSLGVTGVRVEGEEARGVPWCVTTDATPIALLLKSGNFGEQDLLSRAVVGEGALR
ncbi:hypothetical protein DLE60_27725 [Micromonospora globispora]|uniref:3-oxo-tetronate kinase n=1 Tax=Micromonospora globispora TaxID=1450148 RepID=UPI000D6FDF96|nr:3-oxo-tetronate kinase [Micromonospora globispora]PWU55507.1 hypothetical protein DLE60_27725 [Micromonospora globispora]RQW91879.1 hypothetical protein DKL51_20095 [Micromonospora globispora]